MTTMEELLNAHPDAELVQLQLNYADWESPDITARENYEAARRHGKSIAVMEPVKGGALANPPQDVAEVLRETSSDASYHCGQSATRLKDCAGQFE